MAMAFDAQATLDRIKACAGLSCPKRPPATGELMSVGWTRWHKVCALRPSPREALNATMRSRSIWKRSQVSPGSISLSRVCPPSQSPIMLDYGYSATMRMQLT